MTYFLCFKEKLKKILGFGPGVDDKSDNPFMPKPVELGIQKDIGVPLIIGYCEREGIILLQGKNLLQKQF